MIESLAEVEDAKGVPFCRPLLGAVRMFTWCTPAPEEEDYDVMFSIDGVH
jgi:hypothetical protein